MYCVILCGASNYMNTSANSRSSRWLAMLRACMALALLHGCTDPPAMKDAFDRGWRHTRVVQAKVGAEPIPHIVKDCRTEFAADTQRRFAVVSYSDGGHQFVNRYVALVPPGLAVDMGAVYQVNINDCSSAWYRLR
jgi:hypothetical protein